MSLKWASSADQHAMNSPKIINCYIHMMEGKLCTKETDFNVRLPRDYLLGLCREIWTSTNSGWCIFVANLLRFSGKWTKPTNQQRPSAPTSTSNSVKHPPVCWAQFPDTFYSLLNKMMDEDQLCEKQKCDYSTDSGAKWVILESYWRKLISELPSDSAQSYINRGEMF